MAITTLDGALAGMTPPNAFYKTQAATTAGRFYSPFYVAGLPGAATAPSPGLSGAALTSYGSQLPFTNPSSGNSYLARFEANSSVAGTMYLCDRLWHNSGFTVTSTAGQTVNSVAWPARDINGSTNGDGIFIGLEVSTVMGAGTPTFTMAYTNSGGTGSRSIVTAAMPTTMAVGSFIPFPLQGGDVGVRSIQTITQSATMTSGVYHLVAYRILASVTVSAAGLGGVVDSLTGGFPRLYDNTVPFLLWLPSTTTAANVNGSVVVSQG